MSPLSDLEKSPTGVEIRATSSSPGTSDSQYDAAAKTNTSTSTTHNTSNPDTTTTTTTTTTPPDVDQAWDFITRVGPVDAALLDAVNLPSLRRRVDWRIVPLMFCCYTLQFLDKVIYNYAAVMGLPRDLHFRGNDFSNVATYLFVGLLCFEIPNVFFLQLVPAAKWLGLNVVLWGVATAAGAAARDYRSLLVSRVLLGVFEATIGPSLMLISSQWYTKAEQAPRFSFWYLGLGLGQILGGAVSYAFQHVAPTAALSGWRTMFVVLGCVTVLVGAVVLLCLPDTPMDAAWLSDVEKVALLRHVAANRTGIASRRFRPREIAEALLDPQIWLLLLSVVLLSVSSGVVTTYSATLIRGLQFSPRRAALMNMPSGVVSIFFTLLVGYGIRRRSHRWAWIVICIVPAILGGALMSFLPSSDGTASGPSRRAGVLAGIYLVNAVVAPLAVFYNWTVANVAGATKRAFACALISGSFSLGNIIGPQTFQARDAPAFRPAKLAVMGTQAGCALTTFLLFVYYAHMNRRRRANQVKENADAYKSAETWANMTDKENPYFIYTY